MGCGCRVDVEKDAEDFKTSFLREHSNVKPFRVVAQGSLMFEELNGDADVPVESASNAYHGAGKFGSAACSNGTVAMPPTIRNQPAEITKLDWHA